MNPGSLIESRLSLSQQATIQRTTESLSLVGRAVLRDRAAFIGVIIVTGFVLMSIFAPVIAPYDPSSYNVDSDGDPLTLSPPSLDHPFGTNHVGNDVFSQWVFGARVSVLVGLAAGLSVLVIGSTVGLVSGYFKGTVDLILMRIVDILFGIPAIPLVLVLTLFYSASVWNIVLAYVLVLWRTMARVVRSQTLSLAERPFVKSARASGASDKRIIFLHIGPNVLPLIFIETTIVAGWAITLEAGVSFLGFGAANMISWGTMLQMTFVTGAIRSAWWWMLPPGLSITAIVVSLFYISRALEEVTNPEVRSI
jgi:peptide/nickel transport system permease protein